MVRGWCNHSGPSIRHGGVEIYLINLILMISFQLAAKLKLNAPHAHTWLEIVGVRWGQVAHLVFMFFGYTATLLKYLKSLTLLLPVLRRTSSSAQCWFSVDQLPSQI